MAEKIEFAAIFRNKMDASVPVNPFVDNKLPFNDELIQKFSNAYIPTTNNSKFLDVYTKYPVQICRGIFTGYLHAYALLNIGEKSETSESNNLRHMIQAICRRIIMEKNDTSAEDLQ